MPNIMSALKSEISRLARKEAKQVVAPVKKASVTYRGLIAGLRKQLDALQGEVATLRRAAPKAEKALAATQEPQGRFWISGKGVKSLRKRLGLTQAQFGKLVGVTPNAVVLWEAKTGTLRLRKAPAGKLQWLKGLGKRDVVGLVGIDKNAEAKAKAKPRAQKKPKSKNKPKA